MMPRGDFVPTFSEQYRVKILVFKLRIESDIVGKKGQRETVLKSVRSDLKTQGYAQLSGAVFQIHHKPFCAYETSNTFGCGAGSFDFTGLRLACCESAAK